MDINHNSKYGILYSPIFNKDIKMIKFLINLGANVNFINEKGETFILQILNNKLTEDKDEDEDSKEDKLLNDEIIKLLMVSGSYLSVKDSNGKTAFEFELGIENMKYDIVKLLIENGIDVNQEFSTGQSALFYIIEQIQSGIGKTDYLDYVKLLIKSGVDLEQIGNYESAPLQYIVVNSTCGNSDEYTLVNMLLDAGANYIVENEVMGSIIEFVENSDDEIMKKIFEPLKK